ncbi:Galactose oxidase/kelch repeat superfamily protein [Actinidia rufa]|uniref:Galactose oxidase/kelch repeat superfamily protein n=1 Tax=Actinidia rufa TaxID=165716 RepID=A0A7J0FPK3_9ERIC|nr:Galactose oxidase/kelch repeat superfamily protein [Actinidia rufa]
MRDARGEWHHVGSVPSVVLPDQSWRLEAFGYGFAALRHELYILGGRVLKWEESGVGRFHIVKLCLIRVCDPGVVPLKWRETRPMCCSGAGSILGCASMEQKSSL